ncbi:ATP-binding protein [Desulfoplanes sp.]
MFTSPLKARIRLRTRLMLLSIGLGLGCLTVLVFILMSSKNVKQLTHQITNQHILETAENAKVTRDLSIIFADINLLLNSFFGQPEHLQTEGTRIMALIRRANTKNHIVALKQDLHDLQEAMHTFLDGCIRVNQTLEKRDIIEKDLDLTLSRLEDTITELLIGMTLDGEDTSLIEQLSLLVFGYRENLLRIANINARLDAEHFKPGMIDQGHPIILALDDFRLRIRTLTASQRQIAKYGQDITRLIDAYEDNIHRLHDQMAGLDEQRTTLHREKTILLEKMAALDMQITQSSHGVVRSIDNIVDQSQMAILVIFSIMLTALGFFTFRFIKAHVRTPLATIVKGIGTFYGGDLSARISMDRRDEWADIQGALNSMAAELEVSYAALSHSEATYRSIVDNAFDGIFQMDPDGTLRSANPAMLKILGHSDRLGSPPEKPTLNGLYLDANGNRPLVDYLKDHDAIHHSETPLFTTRGSLAWITLNAHRVKTPQDTYIEGTMANITARKHSELELERLRSYLDNIINSMPSILIAVTPQGRITHWNKQAEKELGVRADIAEGLPLAKAVPALNEKMEHIQQAVDNKYPHEEHKVELPLTSGTKHVDMTIFPLITNSVQGAVIRIDDISEQVRIEEMMIQSEKMLSVGGLAAGMAHEINNPLAGILQAAQVIGLRLDPALPKNVNVAKESGTSMEAVHTYMQKRRVPNMLAAIRDGGERAAKIVENMLSFSRKGSSEKTLHSLTGLMDTTIGLAENDYDLKKDYDFKKITIERHYDPDMPMVPCEASKIQQVFFNILKNGAHAMAEKKNAMEENYTPTFTITITADKKTATVIIADNGPGIEDSMRKRIFEPFFTTKEVGSGTGLGLSVSYFIISENHNGMMYVESMPGHGARFVIKLPCKQVPLAIE